ncbi:MAG: hypothetical protein K6F63_05280 [Lachnospiraceae bacterium]|nr:hypothetical protein [Lachnospiraceae bacterium]
MKKSEQFRNNRAVLVVWGVVAFVLVAANFLEVIKGNHDMAWYGGFVGVMVATFTPGVIEFARTKGESKIFKYFVAVGYPLFCGYCQYQANTNVSNLYIYPVFVLVLLYLDAKVVYILSGVSILWSAAILITRVGKAGDGKAILITEYEIIFAALIIASVGVVVAINNIKMNNRLKLEEVERLSEEAERRGAAIVSSSEEVDKKMVSIENAANENATSMRSMSETIHDISSAILSIAENVQDEANAMSEANREMNGIKKNADELSKNVKLIQESNDVNAQKISEINVQAGELLEKSGITKQKVDDVKELATKVTEVIGVIRQISGKTNLLALNASIEAARAGEAGKGFAVVAEEIRALAESTNSSVVEIEDSITRLNESCDIAAGSMEESVLAINSQTESITEIDSSIQHEAAAMREISDEIENINKEINKVADANNSISEQSNNISAVTEEITASAENAATMSIEVKRMSEGILENIKDATEELEKLKEL